MKEGKGMKAISCVFFNYSMMLKGFIQIILAPEIAQFNNYMGKKNTISPENEEFNPRLCPSRPSQYAYISFETREAIIEMVLQQGATIIDAARKYGVNSSTTKMIVKKFRDKKAIFERKQDRIRKQILEKEKLKNPDLFSTQQTAYMVYFIPQGWQILPSYYPGYLTE